ncbi:hypothetical protein ACOMHN_013622 [Nucella lapillus]
MRENSGTGEQGHGGTAVRGSRGTGEQRHGGTGARVNRGTGEQWHGGTVVQGNSEEYHKVTECLPQRSTTR